MTPKEKAKQIVESFLNSSINFPYIDTEDGQCIGSGYMTYKSAIKLAENSVNEIALKIAGHHKDAILTDYIEYWQEVKSEILDLALNVA